MPDFLTTYAEVQPDKLAVVDDRPDGTMHPLDLRRARTSGPTGSPTCSWASASGPGGKVVWCGQNSTVDRRHGERGPQDRRDRRAPQLPAVGRGGRLRHRPLRRRRSCSSTPSSRPCSSASATRSRRSSTILVFDGSVPIGMLDADALMADASTDEPPVPETTEPGATMIYTSGTTGKPKGAFRKGVGDPTQVIAMMQLIGYTPDDVYLTTGPLYHSGPGGFMALGPDPRPDRRRAAQVRPRGLAPPGRHVQGDVHLLGADADPDDLRAAGGGEGSLRPLDDEAHDRQRRALELRPEADVPRRLPGRLALGGVRLDRARA